MPRETATVSSHVLYIPSNLLLCHFVRSHISRVHVCIALTSLSAFFLLFFFFFFAEWPGSFKCYSGNTEVERIRKCESAHNVDTALGRNSPAAPAGNRTHNLFITSPAFYYRAIPAPCRFLVPCKTKATISCWRKWLWEGKMIQEHRFMNPCGWKRMVFRTRRFAETWGQCQSKEVM